MTELSFLIELVFNHKLSKSAKEAIVARIKEIEESPKSLMIPRNVTLPQPMPPGIVQAASTQAILARNPDLTPEPTQPVVIAQTAAAQAALNRRQESLQLARSGKPAPGETSPRKF